MHAFCKYGQLSISQSQSYSKLLISHSKFSDPRKFTLRYQLFEMKGVENKK